MQLPTSRDDARLIGAPLFAGAVCRADATHGNTRRATNGQCVACGAVYDAARRANVDDDAREKENARKRARAARDRASMLSRRPNYKRDSDKAYRARRDANPAVSAACAAAREERAAKVAARLAQREADKAERRAAREALKIARAETARQKLLEYDRSKAKKRRAIKRGGRAAGMATQDDLKTLVWLQHGKCCYCGAPVEHLDHKQPVSRDGKHVSSNLQWLCAFHNMSKSNQTDAEYRASHGIPPLTLWDASAGVVIRYCL